MRITGIDFKVPKQYLKDSNRKPTYHRCKFCKQYSMELHFITTPSFDNLVPFSSTRVSEMHGVSNLTTDFPKPWLQLKCYLCGASGKAVPIIEGSNKMEFDENKSKIVITASKEWLDLFGKEIFEQC